MIPNVETLKITTRQNFLGTLIIDDENRWEASIINQVIDHLAARGHLQTPVPGWKLVPVNAPQAVTSLKMAINLEEDTGGLRFTGKFPNVNSQATVYFNETQLRDIYRLMIAATPPATERTGDE